MNNRAGTIETLAIQVAELFKPLREQLKNGQELELLEELGLLFPPELMENGAFAGTVSTALSALMSLPDLIKDLLVAVESEDYPGAANKLLDLTNGIASARSALASLSTSLNSAARSLPGFTSAEIDQFTATLPQRLFDWSVITQLESIVPELANLFDLFDVIERKEQQVGSTDPKYPQFTQKSLHFENLPRALFAPLDVLKEKYKFGEAGFDGVALFSRLESIISYSGTPVLNEPTATPPTLDLLFAELTTKTDVSPPGLAFKLKTRFDQTFQGGEAPLSLEGKVRLGGTLGSTLTVEPNLKMMLIAPASGTAEGELRFRIRISPLERSQSILLIGRPNESRLEISEISFDAGVGLNWNGAVSAAEGSFGFGLDLKGLHLLITPPSGDGFLAKLFPSEGIDSTFALGIHLTQSGLVFTGSASLETEIPVHADLGIAKVDSITLGARLGPDGLEVPLGATIRGEFGPIQAVVENIGVLASFTIPPGGGEIGPFSASIGFKPPTGVGLRIDAGSITGGGFLSVNPHSYAGAAELSVFGIAVKAFGLIETQLPDGSDGYSFVIVISAEFSPIQLGFGFTLNGVGGLLGVNRSLASEALGEAVRSGNLDHLLFPANPVQDAPAIINDLKTIFPATKDHFVFGPMAKLGWGTPTLIDGKLAVILEFPGPRIALLGEVHAALPTREAALIRLNMSIGGLLDFPASLFSLDAALYDSKVGSFVISGGMATRLRWGNHSNFAFSVGGLNPSFQPPAGFPNLPRLCIDLGVSGNPSLTAQGYFALTSNTAQAGAAIDLRAGGAGITLSGHLGFDALIVFSPFSFSASIDASVSVRFHGVGFGIHLRGELSGPSPWRINGKVCVSVLFWDACLRIDHTFGRSQKVELPPLDPWVGDPSNGVIGLQEALQNPLNWFGALPAQSDRVVSLRQGDTPLIDPLGSASVRQRVVPLNRKLDKFGEHKVAGPGRYDLQSVIVGDGADAQTFSGTQLKAVMDLFAPAQFDVMDDAQRLSGESFVPLEAGTSLSTAQPRAGAIAEKDVVYETEILFGPPLSTPAPSYPILANILTRLLGRSAAALNGGRRRGSSKYLPLARPAQVTLQPELFTIVRRDTLTVQADITLGNAAQARSSVQQILQSETQIHPTWAGLLQVIPFFEAA